MFRMVLADDDFLVREQLRSIIPWSEYDIEIIAEAVDGEEALDMCSSLKPDILFTDIRMPFLGGLEVAAKLKAHQQNTKVVIISGIQDFNLAKTAISINVVDYLLKPIKTDELKEVITKLINAIKTEKMKDLKLSELESQLREYKAMMKEMNLFESENLYESENKLTGYVKPGNIDGVVNNGCCSQKSRQKGRKLVDRIKGIIQQKYMEDISLDELSREVYLTPNYISQIFRQETGLTLTEYLTSVRMEAAKELLRTTDFKINEIADMVGYRNSPYYFCTVFKKYTGLTPGEFRY